MYRVWDRKVEKQVEKQMDPETDTCGFWNLVVVTWESRNGRQRKLMPQDVF